MNELPEGWTNPRLEEIALINPRHPKTLKSSLKVSFVPMPRLSEKDWRLDGAEQRKLGDVIKGYTHFADGDVLFAKITPCMENGKAAVATGLASGLGCGTTELHVIRPLDGVDPRYLYHFLHQEKFRRKAALSFTGSAGQLRVPVSFIQRSRIPLASLDEQRRIVSKLEESLGKVEACRQRLAKIPGILKRLRQSVLAAACSGRLTAEWRGSGIEEHGLPNGWERVPLEGLLEKGGIFDGPFGSNLKTEDYSGSGVRVIRLENIGHLRFFGDKETYITKAKYDSLAKHTVGCGDIIFSSFIADEIRTCLLPQLETKAIAKADCFCLRPDTKVVNRRYLTLQLVSQESYSKLIEDVHGATRPRINTTQLRKLQIRICSLKEQKEIVSRIEALFEVADQIQARYKKAQAQVDKLTQSILAKAFRGELVPTEAKLARREGRDYEPASALLDQVLKDSAEPASRTEARRATRRLRQ